MAIPFGQAMSGSPDDSTCSSCGRTVRRLHIDGESITLDTEMISVVPMRERGASAAGVVHARRLHAELCEVYQRDARREKTRKEMRAYNKQHRKGGL